MDNKDLIEDALDVADKIAEEMFERYTNEELFSKLREGITNGSEENK